MFAGMERLKAPPARARAALAILAGLLLALGQAPVSIPWGVFPAFALLALLVAHTTTRQTAFTLWLAGTAYFASSLTWIVEPFLVDIPRHGWMAPFALILMATGLALFWAAAGAITALARTPTSRALMLAATLTAMEYARANVLTGFPWGLVAYHWIDTPIAQSLSLIGPHGLGLVSVLLGVALTLRVPFGALASAVITAALWLTLAPPPADLTDRTIRLIQPNAAQHLKWQPEMVQVFFDRQIELTSAPGDRDLVVWPETAVPFMLGTRTDLQDLISETAGAPVVIGARRIEREDGKNTFFNSLGLIDETGELAAIYDKHHLVPFGEYLPFAGLFDRVGLKGIAQGVGGFGAGDGPSILSAGEVPPFMPLICYEAIFPNEVFVPGQRPEWLLHITNDAWFGTYTGPYQHLVQARARAIEQGLPLARAANTGVSAMIDPWGRVTDALPLGTAGHLDAALPKARPPTFYTRAGDIPALVALCLLALLALGASSSAQRALHKRTH